MNLSEWLDAVDAHPETIDTDSVVAVFIAQEPERLWSLHDVLHGLHGEHELANLRESVRALVGLDFLDEVAEMECSEHRDSFWGDQCADPLCGDTLFRIQGELTAATGPF